MGRTPIQNLRLARAGEWGTHTYVDAEDGNGLVLVEVSPGCPCRDCASLRAKQNQEQEK